MKHIRIPATYSISALMGDSTSQSVLVHCTRTRSQSDRSGCAGVLVDCMESVESWSQGRSCCAT